MNESIANYDLSLPRSRRRSLGAYYTPPAFVDLLLDHSLMPLLARTANPGEVRIADPACGDGRFLLAAGRRLADHGVPWSKIVGQCLHGVDADADAVVLCRRALAQAAGCHAASLDNIQVGDGLTAWQPQSFDLVVGNPPFRNAIEGERLNLPRHSLVRGAADLAYRFLVRATELACPGGAVALVQPRPVLNARCMEQIRRAVPNNLRPNLIYAPDRSRLFPGALVFACGLVLGSGQTCRVSRDPARVVWGEGPIRDDNWWRALNTILSGSQGKCELGPRIGDHFEVWAGMTAGEAYELKPFVRESPEAPYGRLVTTGLIDPGICHWGQRRCRYLRTDYQHPAVGCGGLPQSLERRLLRSRRPKILVAGLSRRVECVLDPVGQFLGAVSTFAILQPDDCVEELAALVDWLHGPEVGHRFHNELGANAVGGGDTVMTKAFLKGLPMPETPAVCVE